MNLTAEITQHFHFPDGTHGFAGELYYDQDQLLCEFLNPGMNRRWYFEWADKDAFMKVAGEAIKKYPRAITQEYYNSIRDFILDIMVEEGVNA